MKWLETLKMGWVAGGLSATLPRVPGVFNRIENASCLYLSRELIRRAIAPSALPLPCVKEIVGKKLEFARFLVKRATVNAFGVRQDLRQTMAVALDLEADRIAEILDGRAADWRDRFNASQYESLIEILAKHRVPVS